MAKMPKTIVVAMMAVSDVELAAAFTEWERRYRENPEQFMTRRQVSRGTVQTYGELSAYWLLQILAEQMKPRRKPGIIRSVKRKARA